MFICLPSKHILGFKTKIIEAVKFLGLTETSFSSQENSFYQTNVPLTKIFTNKKMCVTTTMNTTDECYQK